ncbi:hypothetical protein XocVXO32_20580 [Xanthomonas oryzae pv. oryzicola]|uniref:hypothetical protein n=1 Tax=Xanthomonas oryzae TaxID=347 RepID=UPI003CCCE12D
MFLNNPLGFVCDPIALPRSPKCSGCPLGGHGRAVGLGPGLPDGAERARDVAAVGTRQ